MSNNIPPLHEQKVIMLFEYCMLPSDYARFKKVSRQAISKSINNFSTVKRYNRVWIKYKD